MSKDIKINSIPPVDSKKDISIKTNVYEHETNNFYKDILHSEKRQRIDVPFSTLSINLGDFSTLASGGTVTIDELPTYSMTLDDLLSTVYAHTLIGGIDSKVDLQYFNNQIDTLIIANEDNASAISFKANTSDVLLHDGSVPLDLLYVPTSDQSIATKSYVDNSVPSGVLLSTGAVPMDSGYVPNTNLDICTKQYADSLTGGSGIVSEVNGYQGIVVLKGSDIATSTTDPVTIDVALSNKALESEVVKKDGTVPMDSVYFPTNNKDVVTKDYVDGITGSDIELNSSTIITVDEAIISIQDSIDVLSTDLDTNYLTNTEIIALTADFATTTALDATNTNVATNTSDIATNTSNITLKANSTDVLLRDGSSILHSGYNPTNALQVASKNMVDLVSSNLTTNYVTNAVLSSTLNDYVLESYLTANYSNNTVLVATYLTKADATATYLTVVDADATFATQASLLDTNTNLSTNYYTSSDLDILLSGKANVGDCYTKSQSDSRYAASSDLATITANVATNTADIATINTVSLPLYLTIANASSTYLTIANASSTYLTIATASSTYLTIATASSTYATNSNLSTNYSTTLDTQTYLGANYFTQTQSDARYVTQTTLTANYYTKTQVDALLPSTRSLLKVSNTTASVVLTTTPTLVSFPATTLTVGTGITKTSNTLFTINKTGYYNLLTRLRGTQTGAGTNTICNIDVLKNGVIIQSVGITMVDISVNTYNFVELGLALNATDTLSFNVYVTGGGGITLSTATINPLASLTIQEA